MSDTATAAELLASARILVSEISDNQIIKEMDNMIRQTQGKLQFQNQLPKWLAENPEQFANALARRIA
jgi:hypothetical protein